MPAFSLRRSTTQDANANDNKGSLFVGIGTMILALCSLVLCARFVCRRITKNVVGADDYLAMVAHGLLLGLGAEYFLRLWGLPRESETVLIDFPVVHYGTENHITTLSQGTLVAIQKVDFASLLTYCATTTVAKASVLILYRRIFSLRTIWFRIGWWINIGFVTAYLVAFYIGNTAQCIPLRDLWSLNGQCHLSLLSEELFGAFNAAIDLSILVLPIGMVWSREMPQKQKVAVCGIFLLGLLGVAVSIVRVPSFQSVGKDLKYSSVNTMIWNMTEPGIAILCACLPILRPLLTLSRTTPTKHKRISSPIATVPSAAAKQQLQWNIIRGDDDSTPGIPSSAYLVAERSPSTPGPMVIHVKSDWELSSSTSDVHEVIPWGEQARTPPLPPTRRR